MVPDKWTAASLVLPDAATQQLVAGSEVCHQPVGELPQTPPKKAKLEEECHAAPPSVVLTQTLGHEQACDIAKSTREKGTALPTASRTKSIAEECAAEPLERELEKMTAS